MLMFCEINKLRIKMSEVKKDKGKVSAYILYGPFFGTLFLAIIGHSHIYLNDPMRFLIGMVTPSIIFPMLLGLAFITPFGYLIGIIPAFLTDRIYLKFVQEKISQAHFFQVLIYGCGLGLIWAPLIFILSLNTLKVWPFFIVLQFLIILPTTLICTLIEWKKSKMQQTIGQTI